MMSMYSLGIVENVSQLIVERLCRDVCVEEAAAYPQDPYLLRVVELVEEEWHPEQRDAVHYRLLSAETTAVGHEDSYVGVRWNS